MRVLVTGGLGRRGNAKVIQLLKAGHEVVVLDAMSVVYGERASVVYVDEFVKGSVTDRELLSALINGVDEVWHFSKSKSEDAFKRYDTNMTGRFNVMQYAKQYDKKIYIP